MFVMKSYIYFQWFPTCGKCECVLVAAFPCKRKMERETDRQIDRQTEEDCVLGAGVR